MYLYRYISLKRFKQLLESSSLFFVDPLTAWPDEKEGFLYREMKTKEGQEKIIQIMENQGISQADIKFWADALAGEPYGLRCQCWCKDGNSLQMGREYVSDHNGLRIKISSDRLRSFEYKKHSVELIKIIYKDLSLEDEIKEVFSPKDRAFYFPRAFSFKRTKYSFEKEVRAYTLTEDKEEHIMVPIKDISTFICDVLPHPNASELCVSEIEKLCAEYGTKFLKYDR